jgi:hypothetical protein
VRVLEDAPVGRFMESVTLKTDDPGWPEIRVPINVLVKADVFVNPEQVNFGEVDKAALTRTPRLVDLQTQTFLVKRRQGPFRITDVSCDAEGVKVRQSPTDQESDVFQFDIAPDPDALKRGSLQGTIRIRTSDSRFPELVVPVTGIVR